MVNRSGILWAIFMGVAVGVGCSGPTLKSAARPDKSAALLDECPELGCGLNGAWLGRNIPFRELDLGTGNDPATRRPNERKLTIASFKHKDSRSLEINVHDDELIGRIGEHDFGGRDLVGSVITLKQGLGVQSTYLLEIVSVTFTPFWTEPCARRNLDERSPTLCDTLPLYEIKFRKEGEDPKKGVSLCEPLTKTDEGIDGKVIIFRGDRYEDDRYVVREDGKTTWFNIACAGTAIGKLHLLRHTTASRRTVPGRVEVRTTTLEQRQAVLRMLTADYCGIGHPFTVNGHPLSYTFRQAWEPQVPMPFGESVIASIDALWDDTGAVCISTPRLSDRVSLEILKGRIHDTCRSRSFVSCPDRIPTTGADMIRFLESHGSYAISANHEPFHVLP